jgi:hypothetical protein
MTLSITTFSITTNDTWYNVSQHNDTQHDTQNKRHATKSSLMTVSTTKLSIFIKCHDTAKCRTYCTAILGVVVLNVVAPFCSTTPFGKNLTNANFDFYSHTF